MVEQRNQKALNLSLNGAFPTVSNKASTMIRVAPNLVSATQLKHVTLESCPYYAASNMSCLT